MSSLVTGPERSVAGKITRAGLLTRSSRPPASTIVLSDAGMLPGTYGTGVPGTRGRSRGRSVAGYLPTVHDDGYFDERVAARYDASSAEAFEPSVLEPMTDLLADLAGDGRALELGIGTGRVALALARRGVAVTGIELSTAMVARLRAKPGGADIPVTIGDFASARAGDAFSLAFLVFNTIFNLTTQAAQVACFANVAGHLQPGGCFVIE